MAEIIRTEHDEASGREYHVYDDGTEKWADDGRFKKAPPAHALTTERGRALAQIAKDNAFLDKARAFARRQGVDVENATTEEILQGYGHAREALHGHAYDLAMEAKTPRGVEGLYTQLTRVGDERDERNQGNAVNVVVPLPDNVAQAIIDLRRMMLEKQEAQPNQFALDIIEGKLH